MRFLNFLFSGLISGIVLVPLATISVAQEDSLYVPLYTYRTGPFAPNGVKVANGLQAYFETVMKRDGGVEGRVIEWEECEFGYRTDRGVECYERLKGKNPLVSNPFSTGLTYKLVPKAPVDKIPVLSMGYGMSGAADGRWFPWVFNFPTSY